MSSKQPKNESLSIFTTTMDKILYSLQKTFSLVFRAYSTNKSMTREGDRQWCFSQCSMILESRGISGNFPLRLIRDDDVSLSAAGALSTCPHRSVSTIRAVVVDWHRLTVSSDARAPGLTRRCIPMPAICS